MTTDEQLLNHTATVRLSVIGLWLTFVFIRPRHIKAPASRSYLHMRVRGSGGVFHSTLPAERSLPCILKCPVMQLCEWACSEWLLVMNHQEPPPPPPPLPPPPPVVLKVCVGPSHSGLMYVVITGHYQPGAALCSADPLTQQMCLKAVERSGGRGATGQTKPKKGPLSCGAAAPRP